MPSLKSLMTVQVEGDSSLEQIWVFGFGSLVYKAGMMMHCSYKT